ncbi:MAG: cytochrome bd-type quinol oxidase subunit 2 [Urechidicola sp.]|jgi:cytochrome bd-type quinol oxidase subunit 2
MNETSLTKQKISNLIIAAVFMIGFYLFFGTEFLYIESDHRPDRIQQLLINTAFIIAYSFIFKFLYDYLTFLGLKKMSNAIIVFGISEVLTSILTTTGGLIDYPAAVLIIVSIISLMSLIVLAYLTFKEQGQELEKSYKLFRKYILTTLAIIFLMEIYPFVVTFLIEKPELLTMNLLLQIIPNSILLLLAIELRNKEKTAVNKT